jgi:hypothetical protein
MGTKVPTRLVCNGEVEQSTCPSFLYSRTLFGLASLFESIGNGSTGAICCRGERPVNLGSNIARDVSRECQLETGYRGGSLSDLGNVQWLAHSRQLFRDEVGLRPRIEQGSRLRLILGRRAHVTCVVAGNMTRVGWRRRIVLTLVDSRALGPSLSDSDSSSHGAAYDVSGHRYDRRRSICSSVPDGSLNS